MDNDKYLKYLDEYAKLVNFPRLSDDKFYFEKVYREIGMEFEKMYGYAYNEMDEVYIPGTLLSSNGEKFVAVFFISIRDGGRNYGATIFHPKYKLLHEEELEEVLTADEYKEVFPYKYRLAVKILRSSADNKFETY